MAVIVFGALTLGTRPSADDATGSRGDEIQAKPQTWDAAWLPYVTFVEATRGLEFVYPVTIERVSIADSLAEQGDHEPADNSWLTPFYAFGLVDRSLDFEAESAAFESEWVLAYYDPVAETVFIPEGELSLVVQSSLVHELTHALQDQHDMIEVDFVTSDDYVGHRALLEGDADWVERRWEEQLSAADQVTIGDEYAAMDAELATAATLGGFVSNYYTMAYALGDPAVEIIRETGGQAALDSVLRTGPGSSEFLIDPLGAALRPSNAKHSAPLPDVYDDDSEVWADALGAVDLYNVLVPTIGVEAALDAVIGYDDDRYTTFARNGAACVSVVIWADTAGDAEELLAALVQSGATDPAIGEFGKPASPGVGFITCEDNPTSVPSAQTAEQIAPLAVLNWMVYEHLAAGADPGPASCAAREQAIALPLSDRIDWMALLAESDAYLEACLAE
ncbi:MAG: hypothetical protein R2706_12520 [Acidimicrobiales bacterium]